MNVSVSHETQSGAADSVLHVWHATPRSAEATPP